MNHYFLNIAKVSEILEETVYSFALLCQKKSRQETLSVNSQTSNIESDNSQNGGLEDYNDISDGIFPHFTIPSIKISLG